MGWSFPLVRVAGVDIKLHVTFFLILPLGALLWGLPFGPQGALFGMLMMILLFACVTLHELGHALAAKRFGIPVKEILLLPLGGLAMLNRAPSKPMHELVIAIAGPLVNVAIAIALIAIAAATGLFNGLTPETAMTVLSTPSLAAALFWLIQANIMLTLFNLIPAFPLDGGRILRALLWMATDAQRATRVAAAAGQGIALAMGLWGLFSFNLVLVAVAIFIFFGARQEQQFNDVQPVLDMAPVGNAYNQHAITLQIGDRVQDVATYLLTSYQPDFAVMQGESLLGIITRQEVAQALAEGKGEAYVTMVMRRDVVRVGADDSLNFVRQTMAERNTRVVAVYDGETYRGLVSIEDITEALQVYKLLWRQAPAQPRVGTA